MAMICLVYRLAKVATQDLKIVAVGVIKSVERVAINVEYTLYLIMCDEGNDYLRTRTATTSDMSGELLYIGDYLCGGFSPSSSTYATSLANAIAGNISLEGTQHELLITDKVEPYPKPSEGLAKGGSGIG